MVYNKFNISLKKFRSKIYIKIIYAFVRFSRSGFFIPHQGSLRRLKKTRFFFLQKFNLNLFR